MGVMMAFIPLFILTVTNFLIYTTISNMSNLNKKSNNRQKRDHNIAMILVGIVIVFTVCNIPRMVINVFEVFQLALYGDIHNWPEWCIILSIFSNLLLVLNSSVNIMIYGWKDKKFREILLKLFYLNNLVRDSSTSELPRAASRIPLKTVENEKDGSEEVCVTKPLVDEVSTTLVT